MGRKLQMQLQVLLPNRMSWILKKKLFTIMCSIPITTMLLIQTYWFVRIQRRLERLCLQLPQNLPSRTEGLRFYHEKYIKEVDQKKIKYEADLDKKVIEWTKQIEEWKKSALASLKSKISCLYPKSY